jgi:chloride channel protein, CIC family
VTVSRSGDHESEEPMRGTILACATAIVAGVLIGFVGGAFRWCLDTADRFRLDLVHWAQTLSGPGWLIPVAAAATGAGLAAVVVRWQPLAAGSGIQHVEAVYRGEAQPAAVRLVAA